MICNSLCMGRGSLFPLQWMSSKETAMTDGALAIKDEHEAKKGKKAELIK